MRGRSPFLTRGEKLAGSLEHPGEGVESLVFLGFLYKLDRIGIRSDVAKWLLGKPHDLRMV